MTASGVPSDQTQRDRIERELRTTFLVEASAGTGKTTSLIRRMIALLREGECVAGEMAAITFTYKAAGHLRERFQIDLERAAANEPEDSPGKQRLERAIRELGRLFVGTIHSFCARLLRERPVEAGLDPQFREMEATESLEMAAESWQAFMARLYADNHPALAELQSADVSPGNLFQTFSRMVEYSDAHVAIRHAEKPSLAVVEPLMEFVEAMRMQMASLPDSQTPDDLQKAVRRTLRLATPPALARHSDVAAMLAELSDAEVKVTYWSSRVAGDQVKIAQEKFRSEIATPWLRVWREYVHSVAMRILVPAVESFQEQRRREGKLDFGDLLLFARNLLRDHPHVRSYLQKRFTHLLVDEFQDTDPIQSELMFYLSSEPSDTREWTRLVPKPGALFVVGDPKQSIYRFRRADIETYTRVQEMIESSGGEVLHLTTNFRSVATICEWADAAFSSVFVPPPGDPGIQAKWSGITAFRSNGEGLSGVREIITTTTRKNYGTTSIAEADRIALWIAAAVGSELKVTDPESKLPRPVEWRDFMLIAWGTSRLATYTDALESQRVPYSVQGGKAFRNSLELAALTPFLRAVVDPDDSVSVVAFLRGPLCGVDDNALYQHQKAGMAWGYLHGNQRSDDSRIQTAMEQLKLARSWANDLPPAAAFSKILERFGIVAHAATLDHGGIRAGNLMKALALARLVSASGGSFSAIVDSLDRELDPASKQEELDLETGRENVVRVMNLHQAKGLEAPFVFLVDPADLKERDPEFAIDRKGSEAVGHFVVKYENGYQKTILGTPPGWEAIASRENQLEAAEHERYRYVAATRAMNVLAISVERRTTAKRGTVAHGPWSPWYSDSLEELTSLEAPLLAHSTTPVVPEVESVAGIRLELATRRARSSQPTYNLETVTSLAHRRSSPPRHLTRGRGTSWGRVIHRTLEAVMRDAQTKVDLMAEILLREEERPVEEAAEIVKLVESIRNSDLWVRATNSSQKLTEVPFSLMVASSELGLADTPTQTLLRGTIDLVFRDDKGWVIVDYKSDSTAGRLKLLVDYYKPQVVQYARYWQKITGEPVRAALFFTENQKTVWIE